MIIDKTSIDPHALRYYRLLKEAGYSAFFVGGSVRDLLLGKRPKDFDIATNATPQQIKRIIPYGKIIGRRFRHVMLEKSGGRYEIVTFRGPITIAEDSTNGEQAPPDLNQFGNPEQDAMRRDFTINALFYDPDANELIDYVDGKRDLDKRIIRTIGEPLARMTEDPIRVLRAIRHKVKLDLDYDSKVLKAIKKTAPELRNTSKERIREEFLKICSDGSLGKFLNEVKNLGILSHVCPWLDDVSETEWEKISKIWQEFAQYTKEEKADSDLGLALMVAPLVEPLIIKPNFEEQKKQGVPNPHLPDIRYFLNCDPIRNILLQEIRVSRIQTDSLLRTLFYWSRMTGLWVETGPPKRMAGRFHEQPPANIAALMTKLTFQAEKRSLPDWIEELCSPEDKRQNRRRETQPQRQDQERYEQREQRPERHQEPIPDADEFENDEEEPQRAVPPSKQLPILEQPLEWNGPLHAPVLRPTFKEEQVERWTRKNQNISAYRPSGIPIPPADITQITANIVTKYKPEFNSIEDSEKIYINRPTDANAGETSEEDDRQEPRRYSRGGNRNHQRSRNFRHNRNHRHRNHH